MSKILYLIGGGLLGYLAKTVVDDQRKPSPLTKPLPDMNHDHLEYHGPDESEAISDDDDTILDKDRDQPEQ